MICYSFNCMTTIPTTYVSLPVLNNGIGPNHDKHDGTCFEPTCAANAPHNHRTEEGGCLGCIKDYLERLFPLEETIKHLQIGGKEINKTTKQLLLMASNLTPAIATSEILRPFHIDSFIASPLAISAMHLTNRGTNQLHKLLFTGLSSIGVIALQKFAHLPRVLIRPIMALAVFFIEKNGKHVHTEKCDHHHDEKERISKSDWINLLKLQGQINTVPQIINFALDRLRESNESSDGFFKKFLGKVGISALQIAGLSLGFVGMGHLIDKLLVQFKFITDEESLAMRAEGAVCACCGAPVCVAETASESAVIALGG